MTPAEQQEMARQLRCPAGENGLTVATQMHQTNQGMTHAAIDFLEIPPQAHVLELGHGNGTHLEYLLAHTQRIRYTGLDISETMHTEARRINKPYITQYPIDFQLYDGKAIPFADHTFDRFFTVNTIYFWSHPDVLLQELYRVLTPQGIGVIAFAQKAFMEKLPFVDNLFTLYDHTTLAALVQTSAFTLAGMENRTEAVISKSGEAVTRQYVLAKVIKER